MGNLKIERYCAVTAGILLLFTCVAGASDDAIDRATELFKKGRYEQALELIEGEIKTNGETVELLEFKDDLLWKLERHEERIKNVLRLDEIAVRKSPWYCMKLAEAYMNLGQQEEALFWLEKAVQERGFRRVGIFESDLYGPVRDNERFKAVVAKAHENMGIGKPVPDIAVKLLDGGEIMLSSMQGTVTLLDFWASWCVPCRKEIPNLKKVYRKYHEQGFEILGISLDDDRAKAVKYIDQNDLEWPMSWSQKGWQDEPAKLYMVNALPSMWLIDRNGILRYFNVRGDELLEAVEQLISQDPN